MDWSEEASMFTGWIVGITVCSVLFTISVMFCTDQWQQNIRYRHSHPLPGWVIHTGTAIHTSPPSFTSSPAEINTTVRFVDYFGRTQQVDVNMPYAIKVGDKTEVDVAKTGSIFVPQSYDYQGDNASWKGPRAAVPEFYPAAGVFVFGVCSLLIAIIVGVFTFMFCVEPILPSVKGRLGTR